MIHIMIEENLRMLMKRLMQEEHMLKEAIIKSSASVEPIKDDSEGGGEIPSDGFDLQKNYMIYFPYNNLSYVLSLQDCLSAKQRSE